MDQKILSEENINRKEIARYLGYIKDPPGDDVAVLIDRAVRDVVKLSAPRHIYRIYPCSASEHGVAAGSFDICSRALSQNLSGCGRVIVMAATLGPSLDRAIQRYQYSDTAYAVILHAAGAAAIETYLDDVSAGIISGLDEQEIRLRPRFSPGYGDLDISVNDDIIKDLDASKHAGIFATDTHLLSPSISVTAFAGIFKEEEL